MNGSGSKLTRIGVFYDGNYFLNVSNYYYYHHARKARISIRGLHDFIRHQVAKEESSELRYCQVVDAHYFRGRFSALEAQEKQILLNERMFDEILTREGVITHYLPLSPKGTEKGVDVWLALESFELAISKSFGVLVLIAGDSDFISLVRKVHTLGTRVMVLGWDFSYIDEQNKTRDTKVSVDLLEEVTYPILMHNVIDDKSKRNDPVINNLFHKFEIRLAREQRESKRRIADAFPLSLGVRPEPSTFSTDSLPQPGPEDQAGIIPAPERKRGYIDIIKEGFGFIQFEPFQERGLFFHWTQLKNADFNSISEGDEVEFSIGKNERGPCAMNVIKLGSDA